MKRPLIQRIGRFRDYPITKQSWLKRRTPSLCGLCIRVRSSRQIIISTHLRGQLELDTLIHEMTHAAFHKLTEQQVNQFAEDVAATLWKIGYRKKTK